MAEPMTLRDEDVGRIGEYVKPWLRGLVDEVVPRARSRPAATRGCSNGWSESRKSSRRSAR